MIIFAHPEYLLLLLLVPFFFIGLALWMGARKDVSASLATRTSSGSSCLPGRVPRDGCVRSYIPSPSYSS